MMNRCGRLKLAGPYRCRSLYCSPMADPAPEFCTTLAPSASNVFDQVYDARNWSPEAKRLVRLTSRPLYHMAPADSTCCSADALHPCKGTRDCTFATVLVVTPRMGEDALASNASFTERMRSRRVPRAPTYPVS